ncbi:hypothetical protein ACIOD2_46995 [Amycolatopsis sp. NPDC088138]|uniref:hypothetical protein n=1 Tax=Amycolatopsis sp. NPDC088138 TaxID=3363938 RepID=UPI00382F0A70
MSANATRSPRTTSGQASLPYPEELDKDLRGLGLSEAERVETITTAWEYTRCVIPEFTNWPKYMAVVRLTTVATIAEYRAELIDVASMADPGCVLLGYDIHEMLDLLFGGTEVHEDMTREFLTAILFSTLKAGEQNSDLVTSWIEALATSPQAYLRLRDTDGGVRIFVAFAKSCNDVDDWLSEEQNRGISELALYTYDNVAMFKHRAEGEVSNFYAYCGSDLSIRKDAYNAALSMQWELDKTWCRTVGGRCAMNLARQFPLLHMMMHRYRFIEDGLVIGKPESDEVIEQTRHGVKLWYRNEANPESEKRRDDAIARMSPILTPGLAELLTLPDEQKCPKCVRREVYGVTAPGQFGGVALCPDCTATYRDYVHTSEERWSRAFQLDR